MVIPSVKRDNNVIRFNLNWDGARLMGTAICKQAALLLLPYPLPSRNQATSNRPASLHLFDGMQTYVIRH